jgi:hypothetical protein
MKNKISNTKTTRIKSNRLSRFFLIIIICLSSLSAAAQDTEFWFAAPDWMAHTYPQSWQQPVYFMVTTGNGYYEYAGISGKYSIANLHRCGKLVASSSFR